MSSSVFSNRSVFCDEFESIGQLSDLTGVTGVLVVGGAGSIGKYVVHKLIEIGCGVICVVDRDENELVELVRSVRSRKNLETDFSTICLDVTSTRLIDFCLENSNRFSHVLNLSAMKHVRSERDKYSCLEMLSVNLLGIINLMEACRAGGIENLFSVSTDKAADPINLMGASKRAMEMLMGSADDINTHSARFANVAYSNGSLLHGFLRRLEVGDPLSCPADITRYFISGNDAARICCISSFLGRKNTILIPSKSADIQPIKLIDICISLLRDRGLEPVFFRDPDEAKEFNVTNLQKREITHWPVYTFDSDTAGEKKIEVFTAEGEEATVFSRNLMSVEMSQRGAKLSEVRVREELAALNYSVKRISKKDVLTWVKSLVPTFEFEDVSGSLDDKM